jgi:hypothetical protein
VAEEAEDLGDRDEAEEVGDPAGSVGECRGDRSEDFFSWSACISGQAPFGPRKLAPSGGVDA